MPPMCSLSLGPVGSLIHRSEPSQPCFQHFAQGPVPSGKSPNSLTWLISLAQFGPCQPHQPRVLVLYSYTPPSNPTDSATLTVQDAAPGNCRTTRSSLCLSPASLHSHHFSPSLSPEPSPGSSLHSQFRCVSSWQFPNLPLSPTLVLIRGLSSVPPWFPSFFPAWPSPHNLLASIFVCAPSPPSPPARRQSWYLDLSTCPGAYTLSLGLGVMCGRTLRHMSCSSLPSLSVRHIIDSHLTSTCEGLAAHRQGWGAQRK